MNIEEAKLNIGKEVKVNNMDLFNSFWRKRAISADKIILGLHIKDNMFKLLFKDSNDSTLFNLNVDIYSAKLSLVGESKSITYEEAKLNLGKEIKFNNREQLSDYWKKATNQGYKVIIDEVESEPYIKLVFKNSYNRTVDFWIIDITKVDISLVDSIQGMTIKELENNIGAEIELIEETKPYTRYNSYLGENVNQNERFEEDFLNAESAILYKIWNGDSLQVQVLLKYKDGTEFYQYLSARHIRLKSDKKTCGMTIEQAKSHIGAEVELLEHTKPYMNNHNESVANIESKNKPSKLIISDVIDGIVKVTSPEEHLYNLHPEHIALKVIKHLDIESVVLGDGESLTDKIKKLALDAGFKLKKQKNGTMDLNAYVYDFARKLINEPLEEQKLPNGVLKVTGEINPWIGSPYHLIENKKPVHEWNIDDAFYANNHGEEVEAFFGYEWFLLDGLTVGEARSCTQFRTKTKQVFLNAGNYLEEDLLKIISDNFKK